MKIVIALVALTVVFAAIPSEDVESVQAEEAAAELKAEAEAELAEAKAELAEAEAELAAADAEKAEAEAEAAEKAEAEATEKAEAEAAEKAEEAVRAAAARKAARTYLVTRVVDGDTVELGNGESVRVVGIDTPERGECGYEAATAHMRRLVQGKQVRLGESDEDADRYGRLLRYVNVENRDAGLAQIKAGLAIARYDSRDGYGFHPREPRYIRADKASPDKRVCPKPEPVVTPPPAGGTSSGGGSVYYQNCDAARAAGGAPVYRGGPGYGSHLDRDGDGVGCE